MDQYIYSNHTKKTLKIKLCYF